MGAVKNFVCRNRLVLSLYPLVCLFSVACFWLFGQSRDALGFTLLHLYGLHPIAMFVIAILLGRKNRIGKWALICPLVFGLFYMATDYLTFRLANMTAFEHFLYPKFVMIPIGALVSGAGVLLGWAVHAFRD